MLAQAKLDQLGGLQDLNAAHPLDEEDARSRLLEDEAETADGGTLARWQRDCEALERLRTQHQKAISDRTALQEKSEDLEVKLAAAERQHTDALALLSEKRNELEYAGVGEEVKSLKTTVAEIAQAERDARDAAAKVRAQKADNATAQQSLQHELDELEAEVLAKEQRLSASSETLAADIGTLTDVVENIARKILSAITPSDDALMIYALESTESTPVETSRFLDQLLRKPHESSGQARGWRHNRVGLRNSKLQHHLAEWMDHLTAKRVAEEMDSAIFIQRLRDSFQRTRTEAESFGHQIGTLEKSAALAASRLETCLSLFNRSTLKLPRSNKAQKPFAGHTEIVNAQRRITDCERSVKNSADFARCVADFLSDARNRMRHLQTQVCSDQNLTAAESLSRSVSSDIERPLWRRLWPYIVAFGMFVAVKAVFAFNTNVNLHDLALSSLAIAALGGWVGSVLIGRDSRERRMTKLRTHTENQIADALGIPRSHPEPLGFPSIKLGQIKPGQQIAETATIDAYKNRTAARHRAIACNSAMFLIPAIFAVALQTQPQEGDQVFVARFPGAEPCILAEGRAVFATNDAYFVKSDHETQSSWWPLDYLFPEVSAQAVPRTHLASVIPSGEFRDPTKPSSADVGGILRCSQPDPERRDLRLTHNGNALGALGADGQIAAFGQIAADVLAQLPRHNVHVTTSDNAKITRLGEHGETLMLYIARPDSGIEDGGDNGGEEDVEIASAVAGLTDMLGVSNDKIQSLTDAIAMSDPDAEQNEILRLLQTNQADFLEALTSLAQAAGPFEPQIVFVTPSPTAGQTEVQDPEPIILSVNNNFTTQVRFAQSERDIATLNNTLILPFFLQIMDLDDPVTPDNVFQWGADRERFLDPSLEGFEGGTLLEHIGTRFRECLERDASAELSLDVMGMASRSWIGETGGYESDVLNHFLAEGRRVAIIDFLAGQIPDPDLQKRTLIRTKGDGRVTLHEFMSGQPGTVDIDGFVRDLGRFSDADHLVKARTSLFSNRIDPVQNGHPLEELLARSVVLVIEGVEGDACRF